MINFSVLRRWNNILHRDIGYGVVAMLLIYGISGLAVNHVDAWNPNYQKRIESFQIVPLQSQNKDEIVQHIVGHLNLETLPENTFKPDSATIQLFFHLKTVSVDIPTGKVIIEHTIPRRVLFEFNQLHLNSVKGVWTYIADLFAVALIFMGISGIFMLKGKNGLLGRGKWFILLGTVIPLFYWLFTLFF